MLGAARHGLVGFGEVRAFMNKEHELLRLARSIMGRNDPSTDEYQCARALVAHLQPPGEWQWVPKEPSKKNWEDAAFNLSSEFGADVVAPLERFAKAFWREMLYQAAAPSSGDARKVQDGELVKAISEAINVACPEDTEAMDAIIPAAAWRKIVDAHAAALYASAHPSWVCAAQKGAAGGNDPQECDWPICECDPYANKVLAALQEQGFELVKEKTFGR
jgi:hypothetical protein